MRYALRRGRKAPGSDQSTELAKRPRAPSLAGGEQTVGAQLRALYGDQYSESWLSRELRCDPAVAAQVAEYWMPQGHPLWVEHSLGIFANAHGLDSRAVIALITAKAPSRETSAPRDMAAPAAPARPAKPKVTVRKQRAPVQTEISIGSAEGVRVIKQQQPTIVWRRSRKLVESV